MGVIRRRKDGKEQCTMLKEHDRDIRVACTQTSAVSEHVVETGHYPIWNEAKFIDRDPHWYTLVHTHWYTLLHTGTHAGSRKLST